MNGTQKIMIIPVTIPMNSHSYFLIKQYNINYIF